jgi:hypothetical protein
VNLPDRISQIEDLVTALMNSANKPPENQITPDPVPEKTAEPHAQNGIPITDNFGRISLEKSETTYVESTHWTAILDEVGTFLIPADID